MFNLFNIVYHDYNQIYNNLDCNDNLDLESLYGVGASGSYESNLWFLSNNESLQDNKYKVLDCLKTIQQLIKEYLQDFVELSDNNVNELASDGCFKDIDYVKDNKDYYYYKRYNDLIDYLYNINYSKDMFLEKNYFYSLDNYERYFNLILDILEKDKDLVNQEIYKQIIVNLYQEKNYIENMLYDYVENVKQEEIC